MQTLSEIRQLLAERGLKPKYRLGQNFLHDQNQIRKLIDASDIKPREAVLEVGPGTGTLTEALLDARADVNVCEIDDHLADLIDERFGDRLTLIRGDCLEKHRRLNNNIIGALGDRPFKLVANLPYNVASPLMAALLLNHPHCVAQFVTVQREVADRVTAKPGTKEYGPLSIIVQALADVERIGTVSPSCFWPEPEVTSAMIAILRKAGTIRHGEEFARFVTGLFTKRRKQLGTILGRAHTQWPSGTTPDMRPEALTVDQLIDLWQLSKV